MISPTHEKQTPPHIYRRDGFKRGEQLKYLLCIIECTIHSDTVFECVRMRAHVLSIVPVKGKTTIAIMMSEMFEMVFQQDDIGKLGHFWQLVHHQHCFNVDAVIRC